MRAFGVWLAARWKAIALDMRDVQFYGGLVLVGAAPTMRWAIVGAVLAGHAWLAPLLLPRRP